MPTPLPVSPSGRSVVTLLKSEIDILTALRDRYRFQIDAQMLARLERAIRLGECPTCAEAQADGVPCATPSRECDHCASALEWVRTMRIELEAAIAGPRWRNGDRGEI